MRRPAPKAALLSRFDDGMVSLQKHVRTLAEVQVNQVMDAETDQLCSGGANSRNGYRGRRLVTCVGTITMRIPKPKRGSSFPEDIVERYQRADRTAVAEMHATRTITRKVRRVAEKMGIASMSKDRASTTATSPDAEVEELPSRNLPALDTPCLWLGATYVRRRRAARIVAPVFRRKDADEVRAMYHVARETLGECCPRAGAVLEGAEPDALAYLATSRPATGSARAPTACRSARTAKPDAARESCRPSRP